LSIECEHPILEHSFGCLLRLFGLDVNKMSVWVNELRKP
jgi:hypothetical protein